MVTHQPSAKPVHNETAMDSDIDEFPFDFCGGPLSRARKATTRPSLTEYNETRTIYECNGTRASTVFA